MINHNYDFDAWNEQKKRIDANKERPPFKEREIWWCNMGLNIGNEQNGKGTLLSRPVLVLRKFNQRIFIGIPLSTQVKENPFYHRLQFKGAEQSIIIAQLRLMDAKRFENKMGELPSYEFQKVKEKVKDLIF